MLLVAFRNRAFLTAGTGSVASALSITSSSSVSRSIRNSARTTRWLATTGTGTAVSRTRSTTPQRQVLPSQFQLPAVPVVSVLQQRFLTTGTGTATTRKMHPVPQDGGCGDDTVATNGFHTTSSATTQTTPIEYGIDMDQNAMMETDMLVAVDERDHLIPDVVLSKKMGHTFSADTPRATLHRAFSFFLFNSNNELLLTQRASSKITFPNVWTNTVCSHPLYGMHPNEADVVPDAYPHFPGIKQAALRKCQHELGIQPAMIDASRIQFISRFHYWAADTVTYGNNDACPWGEHEVDYILFYQLPPNVPLHMTPNPEEVSDYKFVSIEELQKNMFADPSLLWSPWFRGIMDRGGFEWWEHLDKAMAGSYTNDQITYFDPPALHTAPYNVPSHTKLTGVLRSHK